jgi:hypothetical protein
MGVLKGMKYLLRYRSGFLREWRQRYLELKKGAGRG